MTTLEKPNRPVRAHQTSTIVASAPAPRPVRRSQHYWKIHKEVLAEALDNISATGFMTMAHDEHHQTSLYQEVISYVDARTNRLYQSETHPYNDKWTFKG